MPLGPLLDIDQRASQVEEKGDADQGDDEALFDERLRQVFDCSLDQSRPVVDGDDLDALGQAGLELFEFRSPAGAEILPVSGYGGAPTP